jgi:hypothetical protein
LVFFYFHRLLGLFLTFIGLFLTFYLEPNFHGLLDLFGELPVALHPDLDVVLLVVVSASKIVLAKQKLNQSG